MIAFQLAALISASLFTGAAIYISLVEHPARLGLEDRAALAHWKPSYARALPWQAGLAVLSGLCGIASWSLAPDDWLFLAGSVLILANWPFTLIGIMPTNKRLKAILDDKAGHESRALLVAWGRLHQVRSCLGAFATLLFAGALMLHRGHPCCAPAIS